MANNATLTLRALARLLAYPDAQLRLHLQELLSALRAERALNPERLHELESLIRSLAERDPLQVEADYVQLFDHGRSTSLHLFEHVHGDSRERGPAMIDLARTYEQGGLYLKDGELPDYLPVVLEFASTLPAAQMRAFLGETAHILQALLGALLQRRSLYASVIAAVLELAGQRAQPVAVPEEAPLDDSWEEPVAFGGCSIQGQARSDQAQTIRIVRNAARAAAPGV